ncbi:sodium:calcium antiporter [Actinomycetospora chiangmaiensis]|uniref:sodium:calcium antiporter n=1 Tax=Actinomycetospora chiangmaiensis TaxID=402650 RepID=UPI0003651279|nr:hypothetical protein [Actinomycetospora chiangmaiensis]
MESILLFVIGIAVLVFSAEKLIGYLVGVASRWTISLFLIAVIFTGIEFDDLAFGIALNVEDLSNVALGTVIGTTVALTGLVLAISAVVAPCEVDVPRSYLALFVLAPVVMLAFALTGFFTVTSGIVLVALFVAFVGFVAWREYAARKPVFRNAEVYEQLEKVGVGARGGPVTVEDVPPPSGGHFTLPPDLRIDQGFLRARSHSPGLGLGLAVLALVGLVIGAVAAGQATEGVIRTLGIDGTVFGVTVATVALSLEDIFLTAEPQRRGAPEIAVANVIGSVVFSVTGKLGVILLAGGAIAVDTDVVTWHLPVLVVMTAIAAGFMATGRLRRWHGVVLLGLYVAYFVISLVAFGGLPVDK